MIASWRKGSAGSNQIAATCPNVRAMERISVFCATGLLAPEISFHVKGASFELRCLGAAFEDKPCRTKFACIRGLNAQDGTHIGQIVVPKKTTASRRCRLPAFRIDNQCPDPTRPLEHRGSAPRVKLGAHFAHPVFIDAVRFGDPEVAPHVA